MGSFVANPPTPDEPPIINAAFFPAIDPADFRLTCRQDATITSQRLHAALLAAINEVNAELSAYATAQQSTGFSTLADVPAAALGGKSWLVQCYQRAVYTLAKASLLEHYRDFDATRSGQARADDQPDADAIYRRDARWAIADLQGKSRLKVELI